MTRAALALLTVLVLGAAGCGFGGGDENGGSAGSTTTTTRVEVIDGLGGDGNGFDPQAIYKEEAPGVVTVISLFGGDSLESLDDASGGVGSGFVLNGDGEIATNAHVVTTGNVPDLREARTVYVEFADGNQVEADVKGYDPESDVALLQVDPKGLTLRPLPLGDSAKVQVGTPVAAIGSPFSERQSLSVGVVSAVDRSITGLTAFQIAGAIQTDAAINPGNSGGPLVDPEGKVIGINQQIKTNSGGGEGVGFAVPVDVAKRALGQLRSSGKVSYAYLGVETVPIYPQLRERFDLPVGKGAWVQDVVAGGPAADAGVQGGSDRESIFQVRSYRDGGDVITGIDGRPVDDPDDLSRAVALLDPGATVTLEAWRDGDRRNVRIELGDRPLSALPDAG
ncbi:MAG TPA: trypsin-like peptidase domain-containing protein [Solirubrobacteraceae bacterium]|nr:trypsin-like peptidase domain-containing protein [Solirubrobacteraceae bacterium]